MKSPLLIIGAGNVGGFLAYNIEEFETDFEVLGFLDDNPNKIGEVLYGHKVLGPVADIRNYENKGIAVAIGIANPKIKKNIAGSLLASSFTFPSFISKHAWLSKHVTVGRGVILYPGVSINYETLLGDFVIMNMNCAIGHNCSIADYSTLAPGVNLAGFTFIEESVDIGIGVSTRQNVRIGNNSKVGGQTMIIHNVQPNSVVVGVPGKPINN
ncbi:sugar O-acyltransferase (sialic acid O-acetyltransferase NeuD family) [Pontibacter aydingkolensis]|uniref:Acetyltransferase n=1 Tax=Pontibacter aydingkolensis TaxID=1911536 RepID=A0ABS7CUY0_9BACT|nr:NeuD/PglB/VioB family sugar acetyltransferase [Pontibacter aydingkolensis]MBW7467661.1 acetyltransferase [Pontibacter aydingkolensis]